MKKKKTTFIICFIIILLNECIYRKYQTTTNT